MPHTTLKVAPYRDETGFFALEITGGATVHVDLMRKQINPFEKLRLVRKSMPNTLLQAGLPRPESVRLSALSGQRAASMRCGCFPSTSMSGASTIL